VELLLKYGAQPDLEDENGCTPLSRALESGSASIAQLLLAQGAKVNYNYSIRCASQFPYSPTTRRTPLSRAAEKGDGAIVKLLLQYGAQPDLADEGRQTPLSRAIRAHRAMVVELLKDPPCRHKRGSRPSSPLETQINESETMSRAKKPRVL